MLASNYNKIKMNLAGTQVGRQLARRGALGRRRGRRPCRAHGNPAVCGLAKYTPSRGKNKGQVVTCKWCGHKNVCMSQSRRCPTGKRKIHYPVVKTARSPAKKGTAVAMKAKKKGSKKPLKEMSLAQLQKKAKKYGISVHQTRGGKVVKTKDGKPKMAKKSVLIRKINKKRKGGRYYPYY